MPQGLPKAIIKKYGISKKAWSVFRGNRGRSGGGKKSMARRRTYRRTYARVRRRASKMTIPVTLAAPLAASFFVEPKSGWNTAFNMAQAGMWKNVADIMMNGWLFIKNEGKGMELDAQGGAFTKMMLIGAAVHWLAGKAGINRALGRTKVPIVRI